MCSKQDVGYHSKTNIFQAGRVHLYSQVAFISLSSKSALEFSQGHGEGICKILNIKKFELWKYLPS